MLTVDGGELLKCEVTLYLQQCANIMLKNYAMEHFLGLTSNFENLSFFIESWFYLTTVNNCLCYMATNNINFHYIASKDGMEI
jgi:hypothetical protein